MHAPVRNPRMLLIHQSRTGWNCFFFLLLVLYLEWIHLWSSLEESTLCPWPFLLFLCFILAMKWVALHPHVLSHYDYVLDTGSEVMESRENELKLLNLWAPKNLPAFKSVFRHFVIGPHPTVMRSSVLHILTRDRYRVLRCCSPPKSSEPILFCKLSSFQVVSDSNRQRDKTKKKEREIHTEASMRLYLQEHRQTD